MTMKTIGISPKAVLAFLFPAILTVGGVATSWVQTGNLDTGELRLAVGGLIASGLSLLGAYIGTPGKVTADVPAPAVPPKPPVVAKKA
jgi:hypothetical protein